jgi:SAM-dependent methyltransferase
MRSLSTDARDWTDLGSVDPLWAVWSAPEFRHGAGSREEFFRSGETEVRGILEMLRAGFARPERAARALDFGCGVGRLTRALASHFDEVVGVDISPSMIDAARAFHPDRSGCSFLLNPGPDLRQFADREFDLVCSLITLQHVSDSRLIAGYIAEMMRVTTVGGAAVFQLPVHVPWRIRAHPRRTVYHACRRIGVSAERLYEHGLYAMALSGLHPDQVADAVNRGGGRLAATFPDNRVGTPVVPSNTYVALPAHRRLNGSRCRR